MFFELVAVGVLIFALVFNGTPAPKVEGGFEVENAKGVENTSEVVMARNNEVENTKVKNDWREVFKSNQLTFYANPISLAKRGSMVKMWSLIDYKMPEINGEFVYRSKKLRKEYDCKRGQSRVIHVSLFYENMGAGEAAYPRSEGYKSETVVPGSEGEAMWKFACGNK